MKSIREMKFEELVDWAAGYVLKGLIAGDFRSSIWFVLNEAILWRIVQDEVQKKAKKKK